MLTHLIDYLIEFFLLPEIEDATIWESDRNEYLKPIEKKVSSLMQTYIASSLTTLKMLQISWICSKVNEEITIYLLLVSAFC